jgi:hypothetical protein
MRNRRELRESQPPKSRAGTLVTATVFMLSISSCSFSESKLDLNTCRIL